MAQAGAIGDVSRVLIAQIWKGRVVAPRREEMVKAEAKLNKLLAMDAAEQFLENQSKLVAQFGSPE